MFEQRVTIKKFILVLFLILISFRLSSFEKFSKKKIQSTNFPKVFHSKILSLAFKGPAQ